MKEKVVLAYSGGLDTSVCVKILQEKYNYEVITVTVDVGISRDELIKAAKKANRLGARHYAIDAREEFARDFIFRAIKANACYEGYYLSTALARPLIAEKVVEVARREKASAIAHGATGKGNDQFRFETAFRILAPELKIIAPIRELNLTRRESMEYARKHGIAIDATPEKPYSVDENLWGRSIEGGELENIEKEPNEDIFELTKIEEENNEEIEISFEEGIPIALNGKREKASRLIEELNRIAGKHGIGRISMIEDRIMNIKVREVYEMPAAEVLISAHRALESLTLPRNVLKFKKIVEEEWSELIYHGLWHSKLKKALDAFIDETQKYVSGELKLKLERKSFSVSSLKSENSLYEKSLASFDEKALSSKEVEGILKYHASKA